MMSIYHLLLALWIKGHHSKLFASILPCSQSPFLSHVTSACLHSQRQNFLSFSKTAVSYKIWFPCFHLRDTPHLPPSLACFICRRPWAGGVRAWRTVPQAHRQTHGTPDTAPSPPPGHTQQGCLRAREFRLSLVMRKLVDFHLVRAVLALAIQVTPFCVPYKI